jgi:alpha-beta hydrolase superfamily lysophospholipase
MEEFVDIASGSERLVGVWTLPADLSAVASAKGGTTVIALTGWGGYRIGPHRVIVKLCRALAEAGVASLRFDFRGRGDSTGHQRDATLDSMIDDTCRAVEWTLERTPGTRLALWGICSGSNVAVGAATLKPEVRELVLLSCLPFMQQKTASEKVARTKAQAGNYFRKLFRAATWKKLVTGAVNFGAVRRALFGHYGAPKDTRRDPKDSERDILADFAGYAGRAHFVYGGADREATGAADHYRAFAAEHGIDADFTTIEGANHDFYSLAWEREIIAKTASWVTDRDR